MAGIYILRQESKIFCTVSTSYQQISTNTSCLENVQSICSVSGFQKQEQCTAKSFKYSEQLRFCYYYPSFKIAQNCDTMLGLHNHRIIQKGRGLRRSLVQCHAQSRISYEVRPGCSKFYSASPWKPPRMEMAEPLWATYCSVWLSSYRKRFSLHAVTIISVYAYCLSSSSHAPLWKA